MLTAVTTLLLLLVEARGVANHDGPGPKPAPFPMYDPLPTTGVAYASSNVKLNALLKHGEESESGNAHQFYAPNPPLAEPFDVLVEGAQYIGAWLETQPMAGAMYVQACFPS